MAASSAAVLTPELIPCSEANPRAAHHNTASANAGNSAPISSRALRLVTGTVAGSRTRSNCAATPATGIRMPKNTTKNCGCSRKSLHQQTRATIAVTTTTAAPSTRPGTAIRFGNRPSGKRITAHRYATPDAMWKVKWTSAIGHGLPRM